MKQDKHDMQPTVSARRRLIRGAFAAPTVLTLYSGGAVAANSSALRCVLNQNNTPVLPVPPVSTTNSTYFRVQLHAAAVAPAVYYVLGASLPPARIASLPGPLQAQVFNIGTNLLTGSPITTPANLVAQAQWAVLRLDSTGNVVGVGASGTGGSAIFNSCWTSFVAG